ncbi:Zinc knuckle CX2CX4HX4C [Sesbania bispinosa]|nr:Zinc knuckle CX2CX4HX4C [Sesbania bispinosa]
MSVGSGTPSDPFPIIIFNEDDVSDGISSCVRSLIGKSITTKPIHADSLQNALSGIWCNPKGFKVEEVGDKTFQFWFDDETDAQRILKGSPWIFQNSWLNLNRWERNLDTSQMNFSIVPLKVQIWGLPPHCKTTKMGFRIRACLGTAGINIGSQSDGIMWVDFHFDCLPRFCYTCGLVGHEESYCTVREQHGKKEEEENVLGPWLREAQFGRRLHENNYPNHSQHKQAPVSRKTQLSKEVMEMLASHSVSKDFSATTAGTQTKERSGSESQDPIKTAPLDHTPMTRGGTTLLALILHVSPVEKIFLLRIRRTLHLLLPSSYQRPTFQILGTIRPELGNASICPPELS